MLALLARRGGADRERRGFAPLLLLDDVLSELDPDRRRILAERVLGRGPDAGHRDARRRPFPLEPALSARGLAGGREGGVIDRVGDAVARELGPVRPDAGIARFVESWPEAVGTEIAPRTPGPRGSRATGRCT